MAASTAVETSDIESAGVEGEEAAGGKRDMVLTACRVMAFYEFFAREHRGDKRM